MLPFLVSKKKRKNIFSKFTFLIRAKCQVSFSLLGYLKSTMGPGLLFKHDGDLSLKRYTDSDYARSNEDHISIA